MSKRSVFTTITPLPAGVSREVVMATLHNHLEMIDLNPLVIERFQCKPPAYAKADEYHAVWYQLKDKVQYLPGGLAQGDVSYNGCFHDLPNGLQTHVYAPLGLDIKGKWTLGGSLPGEPSEPVELGLDIPKQGLYLREDVDMRCNVLMASFVKKTLKKAHSTLVDRLVEKTKLRARDASNEYLQNITNLSRQASVAPGSLARPASASWSNLSDSLSSASTLANAHHRLSATGSLLSSSPAYSDGRRSSASPYPSPDPRFVDPVYQAYNPAGGPILLQNTHEAWRYQPQLLPGNATSPPAVFAAELPAELAINVPAPLNLKSRAGADAGVGAPTVRVRHVEQDGPLELDA